MSTNTLSISDCPLINTTVFPIVPNRLDFTDWENYTGGADSPQDRRDDVLLDRPTMSMGNRTELDLDPNGGMASDGSIVVNNQTLYERLDAHNRDNWWQYRVDVDTAKSIDQDFKNHLIAAFGSQLELNSHQIYRAFERLMALDLSRMGIRIELVAFVICADIVNADTKERGQSIRTTHNEILKIMICTSNDWLMR